MRGWLAEAPIDPELSSRLIDYVSSLGASLGSVDLLAVLPGVVAPLFSVFDVTMAMIGLPFYVFLLVVDDPASRPRSNSACPTRGGRTSSPVVGSSAGSSAATSDRKPS